MIKNLVHPNVPPSDYVLANATVENDPVMYYLCKTTRYNCMLKKEKTVLAESWMMGS